jgi:hypothetical protein
VKEEALDRTLWRTRFERGHGPAVRQTTLLLLLLLLLLSSLLLLSFYEASHSVTSR